MLANTPRIVGDSLLSGGTIAGALTVTGNLTVSGTTTSVVNQTTSGTVAVTVASATAFTVGATGTNYTLKVDTSNNIVLFGLNPVKLDFQGGSCFIRSSNGSFSAFSFFGSKNFAFQNTSQQSTLSVDLDTGIPTICANTATPAAGSTSARILLGTTAGFGIYYGSAAPTVSAAQGSIYLRSDGTQNNRLYINTNGATTWTAFSTTS